jgi:predicted short-subunit dehydrogenase-like oxidoreductase (DUF2520 family)
MIKVGFIGVGRVGTTLATLLGRKEGYQVVGVSDIDSDLAKSFAQTIPGCRALSSNQEVADIADIVFTTIFDDRIAPTCSQIQWRAGQMVVHCSGANSSDLLESAKKLGAHVGVFHPNYLFSKPEKGAGSLKGTIFDIEAEEPLLSTLKDLATALDGYCLPLSWSERAGLYAALNFSSGACLMAQAKLAANVMQANNIPEDQAERILLALMHGTVNAIEARGIRQNLPGPIARGDTGTIKKIFNALQRTSAPATSLYRELALLNISMALAQGSINQQKAEELQALLKE